MSDTLTTNLEQTVASAPELGHSPHTAVTVASSGGDTQTRAQVVAQAQRHAGVAEGLLSQQPHANSFGDAEKKGLELSATTVATGLHGVGWLIGKVLGGVRGAAHLTNEGLRRGMGAVGLGGVYRANAAAMTTTGRDVISPSLSMGLREWQHQYRYYHDVTARHGYLAGLSSQVGFMAGGVGGAALGLATGNPLEGAVLGAEGVGGIEDRVLFRDSWTRTQDGYHYRDPNTGQLVSLGRDIASGIGLKPGTGYYSDVSGAMDALSTMLMDPVANAGKAAGRLRSERLYPNTDNMRRALENPEQYRDYWRFLQMGVDANLAGEPGRWGLMDRRIAPLVGDRHFSAEDPRPGEISVFRHDPVGGVEHVAGHPKGAYYSVGDVSLADTSPYKVKGTNVTHLFAKTDGQLKVGVNMPPGVSLGHSAATATIDHLYDGGVNAFYQKISTPEGFAEVRAWLRSRGIAVPAQATTEDMAALYGPALARSRGYKSILFKRGPHQELLALDPAALRTPKAAYTLRGLQNARTPEEAHDLLVPFLKTNEYLSDRLPTMTLAHAPLYRLRSQMADMKTTYVDYARRVHVIGKPLSYAISLGSPRKWVDRFQHLPGMQLTPQRDASLLKFSGRTLDPAYEGLPTDAMDMLRYSQGDSEAAHFGSLWLGADVAGRAILYRNAVLDTIFGQMARKYPDGAAMASLLTPKTQQRLGEYLDRLLSTNSPDIAGGYGHTMTDVKTPNVWDPETERAFGAAIRPAQRGLWRIPSLNETKRMAAELHGALDLFGRLDDQAYRSITAGIFKPLVLQSGSYAEHIALAEDLPNMLRYGTFRYLRAAMDGLYARLGRRIEDRESAPLPKLPENATFRQQFAAAREATAARFHGFVHTALGKVPKDPWTLDRMAEIFVDSDTPSLLRAGNNYGALENQAEKVVHGIRQRAEEESLSTKESRQYTMYDVTDRHHLRNWRIQLNGVRTNPLQMASLKEYARLRSAGATEEAATRAAERVHLRLLQEMPESERQTFLRGRLAAQGHEGIDPLASWSQLAVEDFKALTHSHSSRNPLPILDDIAAGRRVAENKLRAVPEIDRPQKILGRVRVPDGTGKVQRIANVGFDKVLNPFVDSVSRLPVYANEYMRQYRGLEPMVLRGELRPDEAVTIAKSRAAANVMRFVHNLHDRTQWSETMRNWAPFWFAQEQAYRRMGRLLATDPGAFRRYQLEISNVHDLAVQQQDTQGNHYFVLPGAGWLDRTFGTGIWGKVIPVAQINPVEFGGTWSATNVMFPLSEGGTPADAIRPGWSPLVVVPAKAIYSLAGAMGKNYENFTPVAGKTQQLIAGAVGPVGMANSIVDEMIPNSMLQRAKQAIQGMAGDPDRSYVSAMAQTMQSLQYLQNAAMRKWYDGGEKGPMPRIVPPDDAGYSEKQAFLSRIKNQTFFNFIGRMLIGQVSPVSAEVQINNFGFSQKLTDEIKKAGSVSVGMANFIEKYPDATPYTVSQSYHPQSGAALPSSLEGENWIESNRAFINQYPEASMWFMPQLKDNTYNASVYNEQIADGQRVKDTPQQFLDQLYVATGDQVYYNALKVHEAAVKAAGGARGALDQEYAKWDAYVQTLQNLMPTWAANSSVFSMNRQVNSQQAIRQFQAIFQAGAAPKGPQSDGIRYLLNNYEQAASDFQRAALQPNYASAEKRVRDQWTTFLQAMEQAQPELSPVIKSVFSGVFYQAY